MTYNDRTRGPENTLKIPVISLNEDFRKRQKKRSGDVCVNVTRLVYCLTAKMMTASLIITLGDKFTV